MDQFLKKIKVQWKFAFLGTLLIGIFCYFYTLSNHFMTYDSMWNLISSQDMTSSGRQFLTYACSFSSDYDLPAINGIFAILYLAITAIFLVEIFEVKSKVCSVLIGAFLVTFPSVIATFCYTFTLDGYMLAVLLTTLSFYLTDKKPRGWIIGCILNGVSLGIYQAYFSYLIVLCIIKLLLDLLNEENRLLYKKIFRYVLLGCSSYIFYVLTLKLAMNINGIELSGYQGTDKVLSFSNPEILQGLLTAVKSFFRFPIYDNVFTTTRYMTIASILLLFSLVSLYIIMFIQKGCYKQKSKLALCLLLIVSTPFGSNIIQIINPDTYFHVLLRFSWVLFFVFLIVLIDRIHTITLHQYIHKAFLLATGIGSVVLILQFSVVANIIAFNMEERYEKTYGYCLKITELLEDTEGYQTGQPVAILGGDPNPSFYPGTSLSWNNLYGYFGVHGEFLVNSTGKIADFCRHFLGFTIATTSPEQEQVLSSSEEFLQMKRFPAKECIRFIDDVWVIKING